MSVTFELVATGAADSSVDVAVAVVKSWVTLWALKDLGVELEQAFELVVRELTHLKAPSVWFKSMLNDLSKPWCG